MGKILNTLQLIFLGLSVCSANTYKNIAFYNFNNFSTDENNQVLLNLSEQVHDSFIELMKNDMNFLSDIYFIPTKNLNNELEKVRKILLKEITSDLQEGIISVVPRSRLEDIISKAAKKNLSLHQIETITDSLIISIGEMTKDITKDMLVSNTIEPGQPSEITITDLYNFINNTTQESIKKSTFTNFTKNHSLLFQKN